MTTKSDQVFDLSVRMSSQYQAFTASELQDKINEARVMLQERINHNVEIITKILIGEADKELKYWHHYSYYKPTDMKRSGHQPLNYSNIMTEEVEWQGHKGQVKTGKWLTVKTQEITDANVKLTYCLEMVDDFERALKRGKFRKGAWFPTITQEVEQYSKQFGWVFVTIGLPDVVQCTKCGETIGSKSLASHQQRDTCKDKTRRKEIESSGYHQVAKGTKVYNMAKRGVVPNELVPTDYDVFVPKWVVNAAEMYEKGGTKYAGLSLDQFVQKMEPKDGSEANGAASS